MATANSLQNSAPTSSRSSSVANSISNHHHDAPYTNGHHHHHHAGSGSQLPASNVGKKGAKKKTPDADEASKLIAAKISQLESNAADEKDQEAEIGGSNLVISSLRQTRYAAALQCVKHRCVSWIVKNKWRIVYGPLGDEMERDIPGRCI